MRRLFLILLFFIIACVVSAQKMEGDTTYYRKYNNKLIISYFQSYKSFGIDMSQKLKPDTLGQSTIVNIAEANLVSGFEITYDKISVSIGFKSPSTLSDKKGNTSYKNFALNIGGNKWILENSYRSYMGFYNKNTVAYDTSFYSTGIFDQFPSLKAEAYKTKFLLFKNPELFSFRSGYTGNYQQIKSAFSWVYSANIYYNKLNSDSSFFPFQIRTYYDNHRNMNGLNVFAFSICAGGSLNIVIWKALFANLTLIGGPEQQWRTYRYLDNYNNSTLSYLSLTGDARGSLGLNFKKWYILINGTTDFSFYSISKITFNSKYNSGNFTLGFRFGVKTPKFYSKFQKTKLYNKL
jgi:hypothetical protein